MLKLTFQFAHGIKIAIRNTPNNGPDVADVTNMDDSMTPSKRPTPNAIPIIIKAKTTLIILMESSCFESFIPLRHGSGRIKSSKATVASEFRLDTLRLKKSIYINLPCLWFFINSTCFSF